MSLLRHRRRLLMALLWLTPAALAADAREVYLATGEQGEPLFTDTAVPGAEVVLVETAAPAEDPLVELERRIEQMLGVANELERSRLAREEARAEARERLAEARSAGPPQVIYQDRYVASPYLFPQPFHRKFRHGRRHKPPHVAPDPPAETRAERPRSRAFPTRD